MQSETNASMRAVLIIWLLRLVLGSELHHDLGSLEGKGVSGKDAWVYMGSRCQDMLQALSSARTLREVNTRADIVIMIFGELSTPNMVEETFGSVIRKCEQPKRACALIPTLLLLAS
jgi:hypothetical protein